MYANMNEYSGAAESTVFASMESRNSEKMQTKVQQLKAKAQARARNDEFIRKRMAQL
jgi:hypothetical protein